MNESTKTVPRRAPNQQGHFTRDGVPKAHLKGLIKRARVRESTYTGVSKCRWVGRGGGGILKVAILLVMNELNIKQPAKWCNEVVGTFLT